MAFDLEGVVVEKAAALLFLPALPILESYFFINNSPQSDDSQISNNLSTAMQ